MSAQRVSSISTGYVSGRSPVGCGSSNDGGGNGCERGRICSNARDPVRSLLEGQRIGQSDSRPGHWSPQRVGRRKLGSLPGSPGRVEDLENSRVRRKRLAGRSSFDLNRQSIDEIQSWESSDDPPSPVHTPLWNRSQANCALAFARWAETSGVHVITAHPYSVCRGGCALANPIVDGNSKARQMAQREKPWEVRET